MEINMTNNAEFKVDERLKHIAFIMDGNGRWANARNKPREFGHKKGAQVFREITEYCHKIGIKCITVYAFSTENWKRPEHEVNAIMKLLDEYLDRQMPENATIRFIGDISMLEPRLVKKIRSIEEKTKGFDCILNVAMNYGARAELTYAFNKLIESGKTSVTEADINSALYTGDCPDPDLIVRTGGDLRISNFLLWQAAYSELYFTDTLWPDMTSQSVDDAIIAFYSRKRRYGGLDKNTEKKD
jgi:undecaprenyl diphosphate synthase